MDEQFRLDSGRFCSSHGNDKVIYEIKLTAKA
jgi:hypothetical protein